MEILHVYHVSISCMQCIELVKASGPDQQFGRLGQSRCPDLLRFPPIYRGDARIVGAGGVD